MTRTDTTAATELPTSTATDAEPSNAIRPRLIVTLAMLSAIGPIATDLYLPAFPTMAAELQTTTTGVQLSLTAFLIGAGVGQAIFGPLSDRIGRRIPLLVGLGVYILASAAAALAPSIGALIAVRVIQGISGAAGMVIGRAVISDLARGRAAARAFSTMMLVGGVAPVTAPLIGSLLADPLGWRGLLWIGAGLGVVALPAVVLFVKETLPPARRSGHGDGRGRSRALMSRAFLSNAAAFAFAFAGLLAYISASPFLYQTMMGLSTVQYGMVFGSNALVLMVVAALAARLTQRFRIASIARTGLLVNLSAAIVITVLALTGLGSWLAVPILVAVGSLGLVFGTTTAMALEAVRQTAGTGSAVLGLAQFGLAGLVAPLVGLAGEHTAVPFALTMLSVSAVANTALAIARGTRSGIATDPPPTERRLHTSGQPGGETASPGITIVSSSFRDHLPLSQRAHEA